jgi:putative ABC transport system permease protein
MGAAGLATADLEQRLFIPASDEVTYYQARVFARDVFQVADLHERLSARFGVRSNQARVKEVQRYSGVLGLLVRVLSALALLIAFFTVYVVFHEVAAGKRRMIGTLRIMGLPRRGVLVLLLVRGLLVAVAASALIVAVGRGLAAVLNAYQGEPLCLLAGPDYLAVALAIVAVCLLAVLRPAWKVSRVDPVVAIEEARLHA